MIYHMLYMIYDIYIYIYYTSGYNGYIVILYDTKQFWVCLNIAIHWLGGSCSELWLHHHEVNRPTWVNKSKYRRSKTKPGFVMGDLRLELLGTGSLPQ